MSTPGPSGPLVFIVIMLWIKLKKKILETGKFFHKDKNLRRSYSCFKNA